MKTTDRPEDGDLCGRDRCGHGFGLHYMANNRKFVGCGWTQDDQRDGFMTCPCDGFLIEYTYPQQDREPDS